MFLDREKVLLALAAACINPKDLCERAGIKDYTFRRALAGGKCKPATLGKIAKVLGVAVEDLI